MGAKRGPRASGGTETGEHTGPAGLADACRAVQILNLPASQPATPASSSSSAQLPAPGDYAKALTILKREPLTTPAKPLPSINAAQPASEPAAQPAAVSAVPKKDFVEHKNILLSQSAQAGVALSEGLQSEKNMPVPTKDGRILYI